MNKIKHQDEKLPLHLQIREKRLEKGWSQMKLATQSTMSFAFIVRLETGRSTNMGVDNLRRLSQALDFYDWDLKIG